MPWSAQLSLAAGVTTAMTAGTRFPDEELDLKRAIDTGEVPGPRLHIAGPYITGGPPRLREAAKGTVDRSAAPPATVGAPRVHQVALRVVDGDAPARAPTADSMGPYEPLRVRRLAELRLEGLAPQTRCCRRRATWGNRTVNSKGATGGGAVNA